jgi:phosphate transport system substrate-binding protein
MGRTRRTLVALAFTLVSCRSQVVPAATPITEFYTLHVYATTATAQLLRDLTTAYQQLHPDVIFIIATGNYRTISGQVLEQEGAYFLSHHLPDDIDSPGSLFWAAPIGQDALAILVHSDNPTSSLSVGQVRALFGGSLQRWEQLGDLEGDITVISREAGSGLRAEFEALIMGDRSITAAGQIAPGSLAMVGSIARDPLAVGYGSLSDMGEGVRSLAIDGVIPTVDSVYDRTYPLRTTIYVVGRGEPMEDAWPMRAFIGWVQSPQGQASVALHYAPLLRP